MSNAYKMMVCPRCRGNGFLAGRRVVYAGAHGTCFLCAGIGEIIADKFIREIGRDGDFFGASAQIGPFTFKSLLRGDEAALQADVGREWKLTKISEEQARAFFAKYGKTTQYETK